MSIKVCDHASVGVIITGEGYPGVPDDHLFCIKRNADPPGWASIAGHVFDDHATYLKAAVAEVTEESGMHVDTLDPVGGDVFWLPNACNRDPGGMPHGHHWKLFRATVAGEPRPSKRETADAGWCSPVQLQRLAEYTLRYVRGERTIEQFQAVPGLELVWMELFARTGYISLSQQEREAALKLAAIPPSRR